MPVYRLHRKEKKNETALKLRFKKTDARINNGVSGAHNTIRSDAENSIAPRGNETVGAFEKYGSL